MGRLIDRVRDGVGTRLGARVAVVGLVVIGSAKLPTVVAVCESSDDVICGGPPAPGTMILLTGNKNGMCTVVPFEYSSSVVPPKLPILPILPSPPRPPSPLMPLLKMYRIGALPRGGRGFTM